MSLYACVVCKRYIFVTTTNNTIGEIFSRLIIKRVYNLYKKVATQTDRASAFVSEKNLVTAGSEDDPVKIFP